MRPILVVARAAAPEKGATLMEIQVAAGDVEATRGEVISCSDPCLGKKQGFCRYSLALAMAGVVSTVKSCSITQSLI